MLKKNGIDAKKGLLRETISIIGAGRVGTALGYLIAKEGMRFGGIFSRSSRSAERARRFIGKGRIYRSLHELIRGSGVIIMSVPDSEIGNLTGEILKEARSSGEVLYGKVFLHTSGFLSSSILAPLSVLRAGIGSLHPLQTIAAPEEGISLLKGSYFCLEGEERAVTAARRIVRKIGGKYFRIEPEDKEAYHLAASFLSNYIVSLTDMVMEILPAKFSKREWLKIFAPLIAGTSRNLLMIGLPDALTGPISRGDLQTIRGHLRVVRRGDPGLRMLHRILARRAFMLAIQKKGFDARQRRFLSEWLRR